ncbi:hypothetical protein MLD38_011195 [Melastoma candidum]|uniref:Uncharacterized protein n=1 Tax=Melastoma candidum TaxID=119954 RepID=A0ACB9R2T9_9MYRT|nr:hypothetical protein MLD38_011195 [Melastoma candidum]
MPSRWPVPSTALAILWAATRRSDLRRSISSPALSFEPRFQAKVNCCLDDECADFLPWLERKAGAEVSSVLSIGKSVHGRALCANKAIKSGVCIMRIPFDVQLSPDNLSPQLKSSMGKDIGHVAKLALVVLMEQKLGMHSEWAPYISRLPLPGESNSTIFWSENELAMVSKSLVYEETMHKKRKMITEFQAIKRTIASSTSLSEDVIFEDFKHAYSLVESRAWGSCSGYSLIPFADFVNHDGLSKAIVLHDEDKRLSEVISDRDYASGEEVLISYGKLPNSILLVDFGFTLSHNIHDEVSMQINVSKEDPLFKLKAHLLERHCSPGQRISKDLTPQAHSFIIREVRSVEGKGTGIPQSLRAAVRVLACTSSCELRDMTEEAALNDGRLGRRPLKNPDREIQAHYILKSRIAQVIKDHESSIMILRPLDLLGHSKPERRRLMAYHLLTGELRVLKSASAWVINHIRNLQEQRATD